MGLRTTMRLNRKLRATITRMNAQTKETKKLIARLRDLTSVQGGVIYGGKWSAEDNPETDGTDLAHPAYWRGREDSVRSIVHEATCVLDGTVSNIGVTNEPWETLRQRLFDVKDIRLGLENQIRKLTSELEK